MTASVWHELWIRSLESWIGSERRSAGRSLAESGAVQEVEPRPGGFRARIVRKRGADALSVDLAVPVLAADVIAGVIADVAGDPRMAAYVLTGGLPPQLATVGSDGRPAMVPDASEISGECSCGEWTGVCDHLAALGWYLAGLVAADPFMILMLRGVGRDEFVRGVRQFRGGAPPTGEPRDPDPGVEARAAYAAPSHPLPRSAPLPWRAADPVDLGSVPPSDSGVEADALVDLVADMAGRAVAMLQSRGGTGLELSLEEDLVRRATGSPGRLARYAEMLGWPLDELRAAADAWRIGGSGGLRVLRDRWEAPADVMAEATAQVPARTRVAYNVVSGPGFQLRLDHNGQWWRFRPDDELGWMLATEGFDDPADAADAPSADA